MKTNHITWILRIVTSVILLQTLYFKFTGAPESIYIFSTLGMEPHGRIGAGIAELIIAILILIPKTTMLGSLAGCGMMIGAILSHIFILGIEIQGDGGLLFLLAVITLLCCLGLFFLDKNKIINLLKKK